MPRKGSNNPTVGIIGFGIVGRAIQHGFTGLVDFRIYDINPDISENSFKEVILDSDIIFICVPTPMNLKTGKTDLTTIYEVIHSCSEYDTENKVLVIKSTVPPGTTEYLINEYEDLNIIFNPEFLTEKNFRFDFINTSRIILGGYPTDCERVADLYRLKFPRASTPIFITDPTTAETVKYLANAFLSVKVSLCNEFYQICEALGVNYEEMMDMLLLDGRISRAHTNVPGHDEEFGFGGKCFPKDLNSIIYTSKKLGVKPTVMNAAWKKNLEVRKKKDWLDIDGATNKKG